MRILITGASGYIGRAAVLAFSRADWTVRAASRSTLKLADGTEFGNIPEVTGRTDWSPLLNNVDVVLHLAGVAHQPGTDTQTYQAVNVEGTENLARSAANAGVKHFIFLSSIAVYGARRSKEVLNEATAIAPGDAYGRSKAEAENKLQTIANATGMAWTIVRPPLIYGPHAPGNFRRLVKMVDRGIPLPLLAAVAPRSYIGLDNLLDALTMIASNHAAKNQMYVVSDNEDVGSAALIRHIAQALGKKSRLWWVPETMLWTTARALGRCHDAERLLAPLRIDCSKIRNELAWQPPLSLAEGVRRAVLV